MTKNIQWLYNQLLSDKTKARSERAILMIAIISFVIHLAIIYLASYNIIPIDANSKLLKSPIAAIYTPFSFILVYEVYLLIYYLPQSITIYIGKQYEIMALIILRRLFKDLANLELSSNWFQSRVDLLFTYDLIASILLFYLLYHFYRQSKKRYPSPKTDATTLHNMARFIQFKKLIAICLVPILIAVAIYAFASWLMGSFGASHATDVSFKNINNIFFDQFFTILIISDVMLLLLSFFHTDAFHKVIRNSGFVISTILIRLSFSVTGITNTALIVAAILFGLLVIVIHNQYEKMAAEERAVEC